MNCSTSAPLLAAYLDDELEPHDRLAVEQHLEACASCRQRLAADRALHSALQTAAPALRERMDPAQEDRLQRALAASAADRRRRRRPARPFFGLPGAALQAAALAAALLAGIGLGHMGTKEPARALLAQELVASRVRAGLSGHPVDVPSSDRHTVKPWFQGRLDYAPVVVDLTASGYPLIGGRVDYIDGRSVAVLVYRAGAHQIDLFTWPEASGAPPLRPHTTTERGFSLRGWSQGGMVFWAVTDAVPERLQDLADRLAAAGRP
jgi:anti-sigma factor RsiW